MAQMIDALLAFDTALRRIDGNSPRLRQLAQAGAELRRAVGARALAELRSDPKADLAAVLQTAIAAGLLWTDLAALVNTMHDRNPGSC